MGKIPKTYNGWEAYGFLFSSLWYLLRHPQYGVVLYAIAGGLGFNELSHYTGIQIVVGEKARGTKIEALEDDRPHSDNGGWFSIPSAFAQDKKSIRSWKSDNAIVLGKRGNEELFGFQDLNFRIYKKEGTQEIFVYYVPNNFGRWMETNGDMFNTNKFK